MASGDRLGEARIAVAGKLGYLALILTARHSSWSVVTIPLVPRAARAIDLAIGERTEGPLFATADSGGPAIRATWTRRPLCAR
jgi:hypothetical protein